MKTKILIEIMYQKGQVIEVAIIDAAEHDKSFGRLADGIGVFVRDGKHGEKLAVGDTVEAEIFKVKKNYIVVCVILMRVLFCKAERF
jgi:23S rRNA (uracil1939-C5)-methyltransferase